MTRNPAGEWKGKQASVIYACERKEVKEAMTERKVQGIVELCVPALSFERIRYDTTAAQHIAAKLLITLERGKL